jgi:hypothetical protein
MISLFIQEYSLAIQPCRYWKNERFRDPPTRSSGPMWGRTTILRYYILSSLWVILNVVLVTSFIEHLKRVTTSKDYVLTVLHSSQITIGHSATLCDNSTYWNPFPIVTMACKCIKINKHLLIHSACYSQDMCIPSILIFTFQPILHLQNGCWMLPEVLDHQKLILFLSFQPNHMPRPVRRQFHCPDNTLKLYTAWFCLPACRKCFGLSSGRVTRYSRTLSLHAFRIMGVVYRPTHSKLYHQYRPSKCLNSIYYINI